MEAYIALFFSIFAALFSVVDPPGAMPLFLALTSDTTRRDRRRIALDTSIYFVIILIVFYFIGAGILHFLGISIDAMRIAGGFVIFGAGMMLMKTGPNADRDVDKATQADTNLRNHISFTPLAMPMLSGPGSISLMIGLHGGHTTPMEHLMACLAVVAVGLVTYIILLVAPVLLRFMGAAGLVSFSKVLGFFVMAIGVQFVINGVSGIVLELFPK